MRFANSGNSIRILTLNNLCVNRYITTGFVITESAKLSFGNSNSVPNNTPNTMAVICGSMVRAVSDSVQYTALLWLTILTIVHLSGV